MTRHSAMSSSSASGSGMAEALFSSSSYCCCCWRSMTTSGGASATCSTKCSCGSLPNVNEEPQHPHVGDKDIERPTADTMSCPRTAAGLHDCRIIELEGRDPG